MAKRRQPERKLTQTTPGYVLGTGKKREARVKKTKIEDPGESYDPDAEKNEYSDNASDLSEPALSDVEEAPDESALGVVVPTQQPSVATEQQEDAASYYSEEDDDMYRNDEEAEEAEGVEAGDAEVIVDGKVQVLKGKGISNESVVMAKVDNDERFYWSMRKLRHRYGYMMRKGRMDSTSKHQPIADYNESANHSLASKDKRLRTQIVPCKIGTVGPKGRVLRNAEAVPLEYVRQGWHPDCKCTICETRKFHLDKRIENVERERVERERRQAEALKNLGQDKVDGMRPRKEAKQLRNGKTADEGYKLNEY